MLNKSKAQFNKAKTKESSLEKDNSFIQIVSGNKSSLKSNYFEDGGEIMIKNQEIRLESRLNNTRQNSDARQRQTIRSNLNFDSTPISQNDKLAFLKKEIYDIESIQEDGSQRRQTLKNSLKSTQELLQQSILRSQTGSQVTQKADQNDLNEQRVTKSNFGEDFTKEEAEYEVTLSNNLSFGLTGQNFKVGFKTGFQYPANNNQDQMQDNIDQTSNQLTPLIKNIVSKNQVMNTTDYKFPFRRLSNFGDNEQFYKLGNSHKKNDLVTPRIVKNDLIEIVTHYPQNNKNGKNFGSPTEGRSFLGGVSIGFRTINQKNKGQKTTDFKGFVQWDKSGSNEDLLAIQEAMIQNRKFISITERQVNKSQTRQTSKSYLNKFPQVVTSIPLKTMITPHGTITKQILRDLSSVMQSVGSKSPSSQDKGSQLKEVRGDDQDMIRTFSKMFLKQQSTSTSQLDNEKDKKSNFFAKGVISIQKLQASPISKNFKNY